MAARHHHDPHRRRKQPFLCKAGFCMLLYGILVNVYVHQLLEKRFVPSSIHRGLTTSSVNNVSDNGIKQPSSVAQPSNSLRRIVQELQHQHPAEFSPSLHYLLNQVLDFHEHHHDIVQTTSNDFDPEAMESLCHKYHFRYNNAKHLRQPRRIFWGSLIADDSWHTILLQSTESYNLFHSAAFVESNTTQTLTKRDLRFYYGEKDGNDSSKNAQVRELRQKALVQLWGPTTNVTVDLYIHSESSRERTRTSISSISNKRANKRGLWLQNENSQRNLIIQRWKSNGMSLNDVGIISDVDEVISQDFVRALQVCDGIPPFVRHSHCKAPKLTVPSMVVEGSPQCVVTQRKWQHPDLILGECIDGIANNDNDRHPVPPRSPRYGAMMRVPTWEKMYGNSDKKKTNNEQSSKVYFPLWTATDFRMEDATSFWPAKDIFPVAWHFHNFFDSIQNVRHKYLTYGHPVEEAFTIPLENISRDLDFMVGCLFDHSERGSFVDRDVNVPWMSSIADANDNVVVSADPASLQRKDSAIPRAFQLAPEYPRMRHHELRQLLLADEKLRHEQVVKKR